MRITYNSLVNSVLNSFQDNTAKLQELQEKLSGGKNIKSPDQGPVDAAKILIFKTKESQYTQFIENIDEAVSWLTFTENSISRINSNINKLKELAITSANGSLPVDSRESIAAIAEQIKNQVINDGNSEVLNKYIFSGLSTETRPFTESGGAVIYSGNSGLMERNISFNAKMSINFSGDRIFNIDGAVNPGDPDLFQVIDNLTAAIRNGDIDEISNDILGQLERAGQNVLNIYSQTGVRINSLELTREQHSSNLLSIQASLSKIEDIDIAEVIMDLKKADMVYKTSLEAAGKVFPHTLLEFLQ